MSQLTYEHAPVPVREDLAVAHLDTWRHIGAPGTWLDGATRVAIAAEVRNAPSCALCAERTKALSPYSVDGTHDHLGELPDPMVEAIHRIVTDPARLMKEWFQSLVEDGLEETSYVEMVSVVGLTVAVDTFCRSLGLPLHALPSPVEGEPSRLRPPEAASGPAWVTWISRKDAVSYPDDVFAPEASNVQRALSLVPESCRAFFHLVVNHYLPRDQMRDFENEYRAITHSQIELVAGRVSALNQCAYWTTSHTMLLRASGEHSGNEYDLASVVGEGEGDGGIPNGALLIRFAEAAIGGDQTALSAARSEILDTLGPQALVDTAAIVGAFNALDRIADSTGIPIDEERLAPTAEFRDRLGINDFPSRQGQ